MDIMKILITYDITNTKNRTKVSTILEGYGNRVNYSVFELDIKSYKLNTLIDDIKRFVSLHDSIRVYNFSVDTISKSYELNSKLPNPFEKVITYVE